MHALNDFIGNDYSLMLGVTEHRNVNVYRLLVGLTERVKVQPVNPDPLAHSMYSIRPQWKVVIGKCLEKRLAGEPSVCHTNKQLLAAAVTHKPHPVAASGDADWSEPPVVRAQT